MIKEVQKRYRGIYNKFIVKRVDNNDGPGDKHERCQYFVLDLTHDPHATIAILAYAESAKHQYPVLSQDLVGLAAVAYKGDYPRIISVPKES